MFGFLLFIFILYVLAGICWIAATQDKYKAQVEAIETANAVEPPVAFALFVLLNVWTWPKLIRKNPAA